MGKKRGQKQHQSPQQYKEAPAPAPEPVPVAEEIAPVNEEITTPVKPAIEELPINDVTPTATADETREDPVEQPAQEEETPVQTEEKEEEGELSPGGESPQGKTKEVARVVETEVVEPTPEVQEVQQAAPVTPPSQQTTTMEASPEQLKSPASTVQNEPLLPSDADEDASRKTTPAAEGEEKLEEKIAKIVSDLSEQPVVQFVAVILEKILVALLVVAIGLFNRFLASKVFANGKEQFEKQIADKYLKGVDVCGVAQIGLDKATTIVTPFGLFDTKTLQGKAWAFAVATGKEIIADANKQVEKQKQE